MSKKKTKPGKGPQFEQVRGYQPAENDLDPKNPPGTKSTNADDKNDQNKDKP